MSQVIIALFVFFSLVMAVLLFFMIVFAVALLLFARGSRKKSPESIPTDQPSQTVVNGGS
jgi:hypothetical protein